MLDHYPTQSDVFEAQLRYSFGQDSCQDREILYLAGGPGYSHLDGCGCDALDIFGAPFWPW